MYKVFLSSLLYLSFSANVYAQITYHPQNKPTKAEGETDKLIRACVTSVQTEAGLGDDFSFIEWISTISYYNRLMVDRATSGFVDKIAQQKANVATLTGLANTCEALKIVKVELTLLNKQYSKVKTGDEENSDGKAKMDLDTSREMLKITDKINQKLKITRRITRIK